MAKSVNVHGKSGSFLYNGVTIPFKSFNPKTTREYADTTDSSSYDQATDMVHKSQLKVSSQTEVSIEGNFDLATTPASIIASLYSGADAVPCSFAYTSGRVYGHGNFDLIDFDAKVTSVDTEVVQFTASLKSNGIFTFLS